MCSQHWANGFFSPNSPEPTCRSQDYSPWDGVFPLQQRWDSRVTEACDHSGLDQRYFSGKVLSSWVKLFTGHWHPLVIQEGHAGLSAGRNEAQGRAGPWFAHKASCPLPQKCHAFSCATNPTPRGTSFFLSSSSNWDILPG